MIDPLQARTIADFGEEWTSYPGTEGFFGSVELFNDFLSPLISSTDVAGKRVADIGAGGGRFVNVMASAGSTHVIAIEPSEAFHVLCENTAPYQDRITYMNVTGDQLPATGDLDYAFSIGVLHHIPEPGPVVAAAFHALRPGGTFAVWLYGREGNTSYLLFVRTRWLPHRGLHLFVRMLYPLFWLYMTACAWLPLPLAEYIGRVMRPLAPDKRRLVIYDQLNPAYAKYYLRKEAYALLADQGFIDIRLHHRHGISWTVVGTRP